jgi:hypothetical protein
MKFTIHHKIKGKYLQVYLNEFVYKLNRRYFGDELFYRIVIRVSQGYEKSRESENIKEYHK